jgi:hypothetical protein
MWGWGRREGRRFPDLESVKPEVARASLPAPLFLSGARARRRHERARPPTHGGQGGPANKMAGKPFHYFVTGWPTTRRANEDSTAGCGMWKLGDTGITDWEFWIVIRSRISAVDRPRQKDGGQAETEASATSPFLWADPGTTRAARRIPQSHLPSPRGDQKRGGGPGAAGCEM